jgi:putative membrane protein
MREIVASAAGLPAFVIYLVVSALLVALFALIYIRLTPQAKIKLMRDGNRAAAFSFSGALIGFVIPLSRAIEQSQSLVDLLIWAGAALVVQLVAFFLAALVLPGLGRRISTDETGAGIFAAAVAIVCGMINAASMTY